MLPLSVLRTLVEGVRRDGTSAIADAAAAAWHIPPGQARHVRTSAAHVFEVPQHSAYLRLMPISACPSARSVARASLAISERGAPVATPRPGRDGLVAVVMSPVGPMHASLIDTAEGPSIELADLDPEQVRRWGRTIAEMHEAAAAIGCSELPRWTDLVTGAGAAIPGQQWPPDIAQEVCDWLKPLLGPPDLLGHGDPQPDNLAWTPTGPVFFDLDDVSGSWAIADLAMAIRDVQPIDQLERPATWSPQGRMLLRGYREVRTLDSAAEHAVPALQRGQALLTYGRLQVALDAPQAGEPAWVASLRQKLQLTASRLRQALASAPPLQG